MASGTVALFYLVYGSFERYASLSNAREQANRRATLEIGALLADVAKFRVLPFVLTELPDIRPALVERSSLAQQRLNATYRSLAAQTGATVLYALDREGVARSASNANQPDSFVGHPFRYRPYFSDAMRAGQAEYFAQGTLTGRPGLFLARRAGPPSLPAGVVVIKVEFSAVERLWRAAGQTSLVVDPDGVIVIGTDPQRRFHRVTALASPQSSRAGEPRRLGRVPPDRAGLIFPQTGFASAKGRHYLAVIRPLPVLNWRYVHLEPLGPTLDLAEGRVRLATLIVAMVVAGITALAGWSGSRQRRAEAARRLLETEVAHRTAELNYAYQHLQREGKERATADARFRVAREELAQANRLGWIGTIITSVAHELNQPVAAIRTAAENGGKLLARGRQEQTAENLALIAALTQRIGTITAELLSYGRRGRDDRAQTPLTAIIDGALMLTRDSFRRFGVTLDVDRPLSPPTIHASRIRIEQVLVNLLQNALEATHGVPDARVRLTICASAGKMQVTVEDNGPGVPEASYETIFQPFHTTRSDGTGLGLGISRDIVRDHGGTVGVGRSAMGGALFTVTLPLNGRHHDDATR